MSKIAKLIYKDFLIDWRNQNPILGILLFIVGSVFLSYVSFLTRVGLDVWNGLFWLIILFITSVSLTKVFVQEEKRTLYYFFLCRPSEIISAKLIYSFTSLLVLVGVLLLVFGTLFSFPIPNWSLFIFNLFLGILGISSSFTLVSVIASKTTNKPLMMSVLGFPLIIPVLLMSVSNSSKIINGYIWEQIQGSINILISLDVMIIVLVFLLFPLTWRV